MSKLSTVCSLSLFALLGACASTPGSAQHDGMVPATAVAEHAWLQQLVGEWRTAAESAMGPDEKSM